MHYIMHEIERTLKDHVPVENYVISEGKAVRVSEEAIDLSKVPCEACNPAAARKAG